MTQPQATAEVFYTAFQALKKSEREAFINRLLQMKGSPQICATPPLLKSERQS